MNLKVYIQLTVLCVVNVMFFCTGIILNTLVIVSYWKSSAYLRKKSCYFIIMVLSCLDFLVVITSHPLDTLRLVLWLNEKYDLLNATNIHRHFSDLFIGFSIIALLVMNIERYLGVY
jgi:hypothetical protein